MEEDDIKVWLAAQEAILAVIRPIDSQHTLRTVESHLVALTKAIIDYDESYRSLPAVKYHSARILLCMIAPLAPSFADECWVALHYGSGSGPDKQHGSLDATEEDVDTEEQAPDDMDEDVDTEEPEPEDTDEDVEEILAEAELQHQARHPETLRSIFDEPFPVVEPEQIKFLRSSALLSKARADEQKKVEERQRRLRGDHKNS